MLWRETEKAEWECDDYRISWIRGGGMSWEKGVYALDMKMQDGSYHRISIHSMPKGAKRAALKHMRASDAT
jgi:hypothetical protein